MTDTFRIPHKPRPVRFEGELVSSTVTTTKDYHSGEQIPHERGNLYQAETGQWVFSAWRSEYRQNEQVWCHVETRVASSLEELAHEPLAGILKKTMDDAGYAHYTRVIYGSPLGDGRQYPNPNGKDVIVYGDRLAERIVDRPYNGYYKTGIRVDGTTDGYVVSVWNVPDTNREPDWTEAHLCDHACLKTPRGVYDWLAGYDYYYYEDSSARVGHKGQMVLEALAERDEAFVPFAYTVLGGDDPLAEVVEVKDKEPYEPSTPEPSTVDQAWQVLQGIITEGRATGIQSTIAAAAIVLHDRGY